MSRNNFFDAKAWPWQARFYDGAEGRLHYVDEGEGAPFLFVHGTPTWSYEWRHAIAGLQDRARCVAVDHLGFGLSERPHDAEYRPEEHAERFRAFADSLDLDDATLVVHDFGGPIALPWILDNRARLRRVVFINTFAWSFNDDRQLAGAARLLGSRLGWLLYGMLNFSLRVMPPSAYAAPSRWRAVRHNYLPVFPDFKSRTLVLWRLARALLDSSAFFASLESRLSALQSVPVEVIWGTRDAAFSTKQRDRWIRAPPHAQSLDLDDAGHWPHEEQPDAVVARLRQLV